MRDDTFPADFLNRDIDSYIYGTYLLPWNTARVLTTHFGTNDRMADDMANALENAGRLGDIEYRLRALQGLWPTASSTGTIGVRWYRRNGFSA